MSVMCVQQCECPLALKCLGDLKMYCVVQVKGVSMILLNYRRDKQMRLGSRAPTALRACCETKLIFETSAASDAAGHETIVTPFKQMIEIPPKLLYIIESSRKPKCTRLVWKF